MAKVRIRTHANPLAYPDPLPREEWTGKLDADKPVYVDMGCGQGQFLIASAAKHPDRNYIGVEVRRAMCAKVNERIERAGLSNAVCIPGNASVSLTSLFHEGEVQELYINFPDPWVKPKHRKRRMIKDFVVEDLWTVMAEDGIVFLLTDVEEIYAEFAALLGERFVKYQYEEREEKSYWQSWHEEHGTPLFKSCFRKR